MMSKLWHALVKIPISYNVLAGAVLAIIVLPRMPYAQPRAATPSKEVLELRSRISNLLPQVQNLRDRRDILEATYRYTRGVDRHDVDLIRSAFWPDAKISYGNPMTLDQFVHWVDDVHSQNFAAHQHHVTGQTVEIVDNTAHVEDYVIYFLVPRDRAADKTGSATPGHAIVGSKTKIGSGRYIERWERRNGEWKILIREYIEDLALEGDSLDICSRSCLGSWDRNDLSYARPLESQTVEQRRIRAAAHKQTGRPEPDPQAPTFNTVRGVQQ